MASWHDKEDDILSEAKALQNAEIIVGRFSDWTKESVSAMIGNMWQESYVNPDYWAENNKAHSRNHGYGLVQWRMGVLKDWTDKEKKDMTDGDVQLDRIQYELDNGGQWIPVAKHGKMTFKEFTKSNKPVDELTEIFMHSYERPAEATADLANRVQFAKKVNDDVEGSDGGGKKWFTFPVPDPYRITQPYKPGQHFGIDVAGEKPGDTPEIYAIADGKVSKSYKSSTYGNVVFIEHEANGDKYESVYAHLSDRKVKKGSTVEQGDLVGRMGETGRADGVHLHFELHQPRWNYKKSDSVDPEDLLDKKFGGSGGGGNDEDKGKDQKKKTMSMMLTGTLGGFVYDKLKG